MLQGAGARPRLAVLKSHSVDPEAASAAASQEGDEVTVAAVSLEKEWTLARNVRCCTWWAQICHPKFMKVCFVRTSVGWEMAHFNKKVSMFTNDYSPQIHISQYYTLRVSANCKKKKKKRANNGVALLLDNCIERESNTSPCILCITANVNSMVSFKDNVRRASFEKKWQLKMAANTTGCAFTGLSSFFLPFSP